MAAGANYFPMTSVGFDVPEAIAETEKSTFELELADVTYPDYTQIDVYLNGGKFRSFMPPVASSSTLKVEFAPGDLSAGYNSLMVSNASNAYVEKESETYVYDDFGIASHRFVVQNHKMPIGFAIIVK